MTETPTGRPPATAPHAPPRHARDRPPVRHRHADDALIARYVAALRRQSAASRRATAPQPRPVPAR